MKAEQQNYKAIYDPGMLLYHQISKDRMNKEYFIKRAYFQGICDSYSSLRNDHFNKSSKAKSLRDKLHPYYRWMKYLLPINKTTKLPTEVKELSILLKRSANDGFKFHQSHFHSNAKVREWVLKSNYWDYKLPKT